MIFFVNPPPSREMISAGALASMFILARKLLSCDCIDELSHRRKSVGRVFKRDKKKKRKLKIVDTIFLNFFTATTLPRPRSRSCVYLYYAIWQTLVFI